MVGPNFEGNACNCFIFECIVHTVNGLSGVFFAFCQPTAQHSNKTTPEKKTNNHQLSTKTTTFVQQQPLHHEIQIQTDHSDLQFFLLSLLFFHCNNFGFTIGVSFKLFMVGVCEQQFIVLTAVRKKLLYHHRRKRRKQC